MSRFHLKILIKNSLYKAIGTAWWLLGLRFLLAGSSRRARVLIYHKINDHPDNLLSVSTVLFRRQMEYLASRCNVVPLSEIAANVTAGRKFLPRTVAISFDDGYLDNYTNALPILAELNLPATIFIPAGRIGGGNILDHDQAFNRDFNPLLDWNQVIEMNQINKQTMEVAESPEDDATGNESERRHCRIEFGGHTVNHTVLESVGDETAVVEINDSKRIIDSRLGQDTTLFAYPVGTRREYGTRHVAMVEKAGYIAAFTGVAGSVGPGIPRFEIPRCNVEPVSFFLFKRVLDGSMDIIRIKDSGIFPILKDMFNRVLGTPS